MSKILEHIIRKSLLTEQAVNFKTTRVLNKSGDDDELARIAMKQNKDVIKNIETPYGKTMLNIFMPDEDTEIFFNLKVSSTKKGVRAIKGTTKYLKRQLAKMAGTLNLKQYINNPEFQIIVSSIPIKEKARSVDYLIKIVIAGSEKFRLRGGTKSNTGTNIFTSSEYINALVTQKPLPQQSTTTNQNVSGTVGKSGATPASKQTTTSANLNFMAGKSPIKYETMDNKNVRKFQRLVYELFKDDTGWKNHSKSKPFFAQSEPVDGDFGTKTYDFVGLISMAVGIKIKSGEKYTINEKLVDGIIKAYPQQVKAIQDKYKNLFEIIVNKKHKILSETTIARLAAQGYSVKTESDMIRLKQLIREQLQKSKLQEQLTLPGEDVVIQSPKSDTKSGDSGRSGRSGGSNKNDKTKNKTKTPKVKFGCEKIAKFSLSDGTTGTRAINYRIHRLCKAAARQMKKDFETASNWKQFKGGDDDEKKATDWYFGKGITQNTMRTGSGWESKEFKTGKFYQTVYLPYYKKAKDLRLKYWEHDMKNCGDEWDLAMFNLHDTNMTAIANAWYTGIKKISNWTDNDMIITIEHPKGVQNYSIDTDF